MVDSDLESQKDHNCCSSDGPRVVILVINWNGKLNTLECVDSLTRMTYPNYEIIIVDNASTDGSREFLIHNLPGVNFIANPQNLGFGGGLNAGICEAVRRCSQYVLCLNNDIVADTNMLTELVRFGELSALVGGLSPKEYDYYQPNRIIFAGGIVGFVRGKLFGYGKLDNDQFNKPMKTGLLSGPAMMFKTKAILDVGFLDQDYFYGPEDKDIALRLIKKGYDLFFVPSAKVWHKRRGATNGKITPLSEYFHVRNYLLFARKNATSPELFFAILYFWMLDFPLTFLKSLFSGKWQNFHAITQGILWHFNSKLVPSDSQMVELLSRNSDRRIDS
jgi:GT2 family glycosyltransferase